MSDLETLYNGPLEIKKKCQRIELDLQDGTFAFPSRSFCNGVVSGVDPMLHFPHLETLILSALKETPNQHFACDEDRVYFLAHSWPRLMKSTLELEFALFGLFLSAIHVPNFRVLFQI